jgi:S-adenosylmethionine:diacylglycerol 3-amino-3-carboxypropyl transferase
VTTETVWEGGRFDARVGPKKILFGRMYEDPEIEIAVFSPDARVFCVASAGCTALRLCDRHDVVACDINPAQLAYAERRIAGAPIEIGTAEKVMSFGRALAPLAGWHVEAIREFLALSSPDAQIAFWRAHLDTRRFRIGFDLMLSMTGLRAVYAPQFLDFLPPHFGVVLRRRMERCFARSSNADNPYARALLLGDVEEQRSTPRAKSHIQLVLGDAASILEASAPQSFDAFTLSNILDGAQPDYRKRLVDAVQRAATQDAVIVLRSFGEPPDRLMNNQADRDRAMLWGVVEVGRVDSLEA